MMKRSSGMLMPVFSLPSPYGIGTFGKAAYDFVDFLSETNQRWWQILPLGPTSYGDSPYQSFSTYAGNPYFIDLEILTEEGLLKKEDYEALIWGEREDKVDYGTIYANRFPVLRKAFANGRDPLQKEIAAFRKENASWLEDYALYMALKAHFSMKSWLEWPEEDARLRKEETLSSYRESLKEDIDYYVFLQFLFFRQWSKLRAYAKEKNIGIIGDIPIYVALDSADVWAEPKLFQLDENNIPRRVSGVPPDYFNADGQLWGNPLYDWEKMKKDDYLWWRKRIGAAAKLYDVIRFDHFRGLASYWSVPAEENTARNGRWETGPGRSLTDILNKTFPEISFCAEDLGYTTPEVRQLLDDSKWPGMKVLQFCFDSRDTSGMVIETFPEGAACYTGTHDNATLVGWLNEASKEDVELAKKTLGVETEKEIPLALIKAGMASKPVLMVVPIQDWLELGSESRINIPGTSSGNWTWRLTSLDPLLERKEIIKEASRR